MFVVLTTVKVADADSVVTVIASWSNPESYERLRSGEEFQRTMSRFAAKFVEPPSVSVNEVLVEMWRAT